MIIIVGLGNPGIKYMNNRHNAGFQFVDYMASKFITYNLKLETSKTKINFEDFFKSDKKLQVTSYKLQDLILAKPQTFMNLSGLAVKKLVTSYKLQVTNELIVCHDDLDIPLGKFHIQFASGPLLHNGLESVEQHLKTKDFYRIRIGVDARPALRSLGEGGRTPGEAYTLQNFLPAEKKILETEIFPKIFEQLKVDLKNIFNVRI